jgi:sugar phosphate isomerase/epimerase
MRLAFSNIAWEPEQDEAVVAVLRGHGFAGVEIAPTKRWPKPLEASQVELDAYRHLWEARGAPIVAMQALLFGRPELQLFADAALRAQTAEYLAGICRLGGRLGARALVFGSPKNRARGALPLAEAWPVAVDFFRRVGDAAAAAGTCLCIEANPPQYACDFVTTSAEARALVHDVASPGFGLHLDIAGMHLAGEDVLAGIRASAGQIRHFHVSAPGLAQVTDTGPLDLLAIARTLGETGYDGWVSVEMRGADDPASNVARVASTAALVARVFG